MIDIKSMTLEELKTDMAELSEKPFRAKQLYEWMHKKLAESFDEMTNISAALKENADSVTAIQTLSVSDSRSQK